MTTSIIKNGQTDIKVIGQIFSYLIRDLNLEFEWFIPQFSTYFIDRILILLNIIGNLYLFIHSSTYPLRHLYMKEYKIPIRGYYDRGKFLLI